MTQPILSSRQQWVACDGVDFCLRVGAELLTANGSWPARIITTWPTDSNSLKSSLRFFRWVCLPLLSSCSHVAPCYDATTHFCFFLTGCNYSSTEVTATADSLLQIETCCQSHSIKMPLSVPHIYFFTVIQKMEKEKEWNYEWSVATLQTTRPYVLGQASNSCKIAKQGIFK